jgi:TPP-dependent pyruvate/acetoin dehydrogenase alpha subunit
VGFQGSQTDLFPQRGRERTVNRIEKPLERQATDLVANYRSVLRIRLVEETIAQRYKDQKMRCPVHLSIGQEAIAVGISAALSRSDQVVSTHRCHAHYLAKGGDLFALFSELMGKATGCCAGRGGSMHLFDPAAGVLASLPIVGASIPVGVGAALAFKLEGRSEVAVIFMGDAAVEEGVFHESANFAALKKLPAIFVCENNLYSVYTRLHDRQPQRPLTDIAYAHGIPSTRIDGNDLTAVHAASVEAVARARSGAGPSFIVADTYRWREHCGPNYDNDLGYRSHAEFEQWQKRDPLVRLREKLFGEGLLSAPVEADMRRDVESEIEATFAAADAAPMPDAETAGTGVYAPPQR